MILFYFSKNLPNILKDYVNKSSEPSSKLMECRNANQVREKIKDKTEEMVDFDKNRIITVLLNDYIFVQTT
jgi:hypothetical protein